MLKAVEVEKGILGPEVDEITEIAKILNRLPRDYRLIIYGQLIAHQTMAGMDELLPPVMAAVQAE